MTYYIGKRTRVSYGKEDPLEDYGTVCVAGTYSWMGVAQNVAPSSKSDIIQINAMDDADTRNVSAYFETLRTYGFSCEFLMQHARPLYFAWGDDVLDSSGVNEVHTITGTNTIPAFTFQVGYEGSTNHVITYTGCMINKLDIACTKGEFLKCSAEVVAQAATNDVTFKEYQTSNVVMKEYPSVGIGSILPYHYSHSDIEINDTSYCEVDSVKLSINNNLLVEPTLCSDNSKRISEPIPQLREYDASATVRMQSAVFYDLWETGAYLTTPPVFTFARSSSDKIEFTLNDAILESSISPFNIGEGMVLVELPFKVRSIGVIETNKLDVIYSDEEA